MTKTFGLSDADAEKIPRLGCIVWHECSTTGQTYDEVEALVEANGFGGTFPKANRKKAYHHALKSYGRRSHDSRRVTVDKITGSATKFFHQITAVEQTPMQTRHEEFLDFRAEVKTAFDRDTEEFAVIPISQGSKTVDLESELQAHIENYLGNVHADVVRDWVTNELRKMNAVVARRSGGLWFVAAEYADRVEALDSVLAGMGCTLYSHPVYDTSTWRTNTAGFVEQDLLGEFRNMKSDLDDLMDEAKGAGEVRKYKLETMLSRFKKLEEKEGMYESLLQVTIEDLQSGVETVKKQITNMMLGKVAGVEPVDRVREIRERARAEARKVKKAANAAKKAAAAEKKNAAAAKKKKLAAKLSTVKKAAPKKAAAVKAEKKIDTPF